MGKFLMEIEAPDDKDMIDMSTLSGDDPDEEKLDEEKKQKRDIEARKREDMEEMQDDDYQRMQRENVAVMRRYLAQAPKREARKRERAREEAAAAEKRRRQVERRWRRELEEQLKQPTTMEERGEAPRPEKYRPRRKTTEQLAQEQIREQTERVRSKFPLMQGVGVTRSGKRFPLELTLSDTASKTVKRAPLVKTTMAVPLPSKAPLNRPGQQAQVLEIIEIASQSPESSSSQSAPGGQEIPEDMEDMEGDEELFTFVVPDASGDDNDNDAPPEEDDDNDSDEEDDNDDAPPEEDDDDDDDDGDSVVVAVRPKRARPEAMMQGRAGSGTVGTVGADGDFGNLLAYFTTRVARFARREAERETVTVSAELSFEMDDTSDSVATRARQIYGHMMMHPERLVGQFSTDYTPDRRTVEDILDGKRRPEYE